MNAVSTLQLPPVWLFCVDRENCTSEEANSPLQLSIDLYLLSHAHFWEIQTNLKDFDVSPSQNDTQSVTQKYQFHWETRHIKSIKTSDVCFTVTLMLCDEQFDNCN